MIRIKDNRFQLILAVLLMIAALTACSFNQIKNDIKDDIKDDNTQGRVEDTEPAKDDSQKPQQSPEQQAQTAADALLKKMTLDEKIYQLFFVTPESVTGVGTVIQAGETTKAALQKYPVGGIVYFASNLQNRQQVKTMMENTQSYSKLPLFIGVDEEGGSVARIGNNPQMGTTKIPPMSTVGASKDPAKAFEVGDTIGSEIKELGFNVDFAPVADVITNPKNTEIGNRAFSSDANVAALMVPEVVKGLESNNVCAALKHFPGHGSTSANSHTGYSESLRTMEQLRSTELLPFRAGIDAGVDFVMVSHMTAVNAVQKNVPCSLSKEIITGLLKEEMGFSGLVITDSLSMGAITSKYSASQSAAMALEAGADILLMPPDLSAAYSGVASALKSGDLTQQRIDESVKKILMLKIKRGIIKQ